MLQQYLLLSKELILLSYRSQPNGRSTTNLQAHCFGRQFLQQCTSQLFDLQEVAGQTVEDSLCIWNSHTVSQSKAFWVCHKEAKGIFSGLTAFINMRLNIDLLHLLGLDF